MKTGLVACAFVAAIGLAACGGGDPVEDFVPTRVIAFGDENSVIEDPTGSGNGRSYTVNGFDTTDAADCGVQPNWVQAFARAYGLYFPQCTKGLPPGASTVSRIFAAPGAKAADLKGQIDAFLAGGGTFQLRDIATVLVGQNDVLEIYALVKAGTMSLDAGKTELAARAAVARGQVDRIVGLRGKVVMSTVPELSVSPFAVKESATTTPNAVTLLRELNKAFNESFRLSGIEDGTKIGLILSDQTIYIAAINVPTSGYTNWQDSYCAEANQSKPTATGIGDLDKLLSCTTKTSSSTSATLAYMWADSTHLGPTAHSGIAKLAIDRLARNAFSD